MHAESSEVISLVPSFSRHFERSRVVMSLGSCIPLFGCFLQIIGALLVLTSSLLLGPDRLDEHEPSRHTPHHITRASATVPAAIPTALSAARRHPVTICRSVLFLSVPFLSYFFLARNRTTTTLSYITYAEPHHSEYYSSFIPPRSRTCP